MSVHEFCHFKVLITLEQVSTTEWSKKRRVLKLLAKLRWLGVVNFYYMQMGLVMSMQFVFGDD